MGIGDLEFRSGSSRNQEDFITVHIFRGASEENVNHARVISESSQTATATRTRGLGGGPHSRLEGLALVHRTSHKNRPTDFVRGPWHQRVPGGVNVASAIRGNRVAVRWERGGFEIAFGFKGRPCVVQSRVEDRIYFLAVDGGPESAFAASPDHVHATILAERQLRSANCSGDSRAPRPAVDLNRCAESLVCRRLAHVENIPAVGRALVVDQMDGSLGVHCRLRVNATIGSADESDFLGLSRDQIKTEQAKQEEKTELTKLAFGKYAVGDWCGV
jgi:hypothetical protein